MDRGGGVIRSEAAKQHPAADELTHTVNKKSERAGTPPGRAWKDPNEMAGRATVLCNQHWQSTRAKEKAAAACHSA